MSGYVDIVFTERNVENGAIIFASNVATRNIRKISRMSSGSSLLQAVENTCVATSALQSTNRGKKLKKSSE